jgi:hypothetical protein
MLIAPLALQRARTVATALGHTWAECPALEYIDIEISLSDLETIVQSGQIIDLFSTRGHISSTGRLSVSIDPTTAAVSITVFRPVSNLRYYRIGRPVLHVELRDKTADVVYRASDCEARHLYSAQLILEAFGLPTFEQEVLGAAKAELRAMVAS